MTPFVWVVLIVAFAVLVWMGVVKWHDRDECRTCKGLGITWRGTGYETCPRCASIRRHPSGRDL